MNPILIFILAIAIGVVITDYLIWKLQKFRGTDTYQKSQKGIIKLLKWEEQMVIKFQTSVLGLFSNKKIQRIKPQTNVLGLFSNIKLQRIKPAFLLEIILIGIWAFWIGQDYLNFDPSIIPSGREFSSAPGRRPAATFGHDFKNAVGVLYGMELFEEDFQHSLIFTEACFIHSSSSVPCF